MAPRQPKPRTTATPSRSGPARLPTEPATTHLAMFRSVEAGCEVHPSRLCEAHERAGSGVQQAGRREQDAEVRRRRRREQRHTERGPPAQHHAAAPSGVREKRESRLHGGAEDPGDRQHQADLDVGERELPTDQGPGGFPQAEHQLVQELDREEDRDRVAGGGRGQPKGFGTRITRGYRMPARRTAGWRRMDLPRDEEIALARRLLLIVGIGYLVVQLFAFSLDRPPSWDEAIYLSQVSPGAVTLPFLPYRARGITFIALPVLQLGGSLPQLRLFLAVASAAALTASFRAWASIIGFGAVGAALLFVGVWPTLLYGSELMPNLWVALIGVAATAVLAPKDRAWRRSLRRAARWRARRGGGPDPPARCDRADLGTARAPDRDPTGDGRLDGPSPPRRRRGVAPWLVEMSIRFGSPGAAISAAARFGPAGSWSFSGACVSTSPSATGPRSVPIQGPSCRWSACSGSSGS